MRYNHKKIEKKWREKWEKDKLYEVDLSKAKRPFYNLMMFPYPSAEGLHVGNMYAFVHSDTYGRFMRLKGFDVFEPIGLDGFGIHSENYAIKIGEHIKDVSRRTEKNFYSQLKMIGNGYDWSRTVETYKQEYYKWTQWLFLKMHEKGLAYRKEAPVNWCPSCKTVLSDEQVIQGECERCGHETEKKNMAQWFFKITDYVERLLDNLEEIDWSEDVKLIQKNWIGKSEGAIVKFLISNSPNSSNKNSERYIEVFTTRPDTLFGCTYFVLAPENKIVDSLKPKIKNWDKVREYIKKTAKKSEVDRTAERKEKTGIKLEGIFAINPVNKKEIPVFVADYVLADYGGGAVMAVPAHDERDFEFAKKYGLSIKKVVEPHALAHMPRNAEDIAVGAKSELKIESECWPGEGVNINSDFLNGLETKEAKEKITKWLEKEKLGKKTASYKIRDWCVSRQRYWGPPIPLIFCPSCKKLVENHKSQITNPKQIQNSKFKIQNLEFNLGEILSPGWIAVPEDKLPVPLPEMDDFLPDGSGKGPLNKVDEFVNTTCPKCGGLAKRETDVSDPFVDSSWYFMRYLNAHDDDKPFDKLRARKWMPVDMYIGGKEHSVLHLLYSRFVNMVMHELGYVPEEEPFKQFRAHGLLIKEGTKISKSKGNIVNPDEYIEKFGADTVRMYLMFLGDMRQGGDWRDEGIVGISRFLHKIWRLKSQIPNHKSQTKHKLQNTNTKLERLLHQTIKKVTEDLENLKFNTAISQLMILVNEMEKSYKLQATSYELLIILLAPFAPFITEELWEQVGNKDSVHQQEWPEYDKKKIKEEKFQLVIQANGKVRDTIEADVGISEKEAKEVALKSEKIQKFIEGKEIKKTIYIKDKILNLVF